MAYITRELERKFMKLNGFFKAVLVTGARQVGKTTMLKHLCEGTDRTYVSLDNIMARELAQTDPVLFFQTYKPPILIDEVQKAPELFEQIKIMCDESDEKGLLPLSTFHWKHCKQGKSRFLKMMLKKSSIIFGKAECHRCLVWTMNFVWNITALM